MTKTEFLKAYSKLLKKHGSQRAVASATKIARTTIQEWLKEDVGPKFIDRKPSKPVVVSVPESGTRRFILTSAQDGTNVHEGFLTNLEAYAAYLGAAISIAGFTYNKRLFQENRKDDPRWTGYHTRVEPYLEHNQVQIGDNLLWCAEMNTLPTAVTPLTGFEVYTGSKWGIFPHAKVQLSSVPTMKHTPAKQIMTTGAVTLPNYVQKRAGIKAQFHHIIGAVLVEIDSDGHHFCRHLLADKNGSFYDLTRFVADGRVTEGHRLEAINWGDIHLEKLDSVVAKAAWGLSIESDGVVVSDEEAREVSMLAELDPKVQLFHDATDFSVRNHHSIKDPHFRFKMHVAGTERVEDAFDGLSDFLLLTEGESCLSVVVESNHDLAVKRWLAESDWRDDPVNAIFFLEAQFEVLKAIKAGEDFSVLEWAVTRNRESDFDRIAFLREDESFTICDGLIECGMHGHLGANGSRGSPKQFTRMGQRANTGHTHSASIIDGIYTAGVSGSLDMGYNKGLSSWSHSHILTYPSGKRTIVTMMDGKWHAD